MAQFNGVLSGNSSFLPSEREETIVGENAIKEQTIARENDWAELMKTFYC